MVVSGQLHTPAALSPGKEPNGIHWIGDWVGARAGLDIMEMKRNPFPSEELNRDSSVVQPVA
jgi:hypothetical protein